MMKRSVSRFCFRCCLVLLLFGSLGIGYSLADSAKGLATVYSIGSSTVRGDNLQVSRDAAIADGLVSAVTRQVTDLLPPEKLAGNFQVVSESILSNTDRFIRNYKVMTDSVQGGSHRVLVQVTLSLDQLRSVIKQAGIRLDTANSPRILVCVAEKGIADLNYSYWWGGTSVGNGTATSVLSRKLMRAGYRVIDPARSSGTANYPAELSSTEAVALARQAGAQVVVVGLAWSEESPNTMEGSIRSFRGNVDARIYRVDNGEQIGAVRQVAVAAGTDANAGGNEALTHAAEQAGDDVNTQIAAAGLDKGGASQIEVTVEGTGGNIASFVKFRGALGNISGVDQLQLKEMMADAAVLLVAYQGNAASLADALLLQSFDTFGINISDIGTTTIRLRPGSAAVNKNIRHRHTGA